MIRKSVLAVLFTVLSFLLQSCLMPYLSIGNVSGSLVIAWIAVAVVALGTSWAFCVGSVIGILYECCLSSVSDVYLLLYPIFTIVLCVVFADYSENKRERKMQGNGRLTLLTRQKKDPGVQLPPHLRTILCAACFEAAMQIFLVGYSSLTGSGLDMGHVARALLAVAYTTGLTAVLMFPLRAALGMYKR